MQSTPRLIMGGGSSRVLALAAQHADDISILPSLRSGRSGAHRSPEASLEAFHRKSQWVQQHAGPRWPTMNISTQVFFLHVGRDKSVYLDRIASKLPLPRHRLAESPLVLAGEVAEICDVIRGRQQLLGLNYLLIDHAHMHAFAPVVEALAAS
ncbi:hypothetical protein [Actinomadura sp. 6K520]|uniref:hypothetical protein n=1 Tax=Actinomadura sp. 6K520 TaxID=2530364 RepID=UPI001052901C|nr:hypothetical protein [Actinomadura sp. 6K520]TDE22957.1 hypothetical protein E1289_28965 [Actinomadura sp. 6K520]